MISFTEPVKKRLLDFSNEIESKKIPEEGIPLKAKGLIPMIETAMKMQSRELLKSGDKTVPTSLVPSGLRGSTVTVKNVVNEAIELYGNFKDQTQSPGQFKFIPGTVKKLVECFDAITGTLKAKAE